MDGIWQVHTSESNSMHECLPEVESLVSLLWVSVCMMWDKLWKIELLLFCWDRNPIYEYIFFWKLSNLPFFLCVVCFIFKTVMIMYITREQRIWQVVWVPSELLEKLYFEKYILKYIVNVVNFYIQVYYIIFMQ